MIEVSPATGYVVDGDSTAHFGAADNALLCSARLTVSPLEASIEARKDFTNLHSQLVVLQRRTSLSEVSWGCVDQCGEALPDIADQQAVDPRSGISRI